MFCKFSQAARACLCELERVRSVGCIVQKQPVRVGFVIAHVEVSWEKAVVSS